MSDGQIALNLESTSPGLFFKNSAGTLVKAGPVHVGTTAPNATPAAGGTAGNSTGELWLDTSLTPNELKSWNGSAWVSALPDEIPVSKLADGTARQLLQTDAAGTGVEWASNIDIPGTLDVTGAAVFDSTVTIGGSSALVASAIGSTVQAYDVDTAKTDVAQTFTAGQRAEVTALTDAATISVDFADSNNFSVTLGGNRTLGNPTNQVAGQSGSIFVTQDGTGGRTLAYSSNWDFAGGTAPTLSTAANAIDRIDYIVRASGSIHAVLTKAFS